MTHTPGPWIIRKAGGLPMNGQPHPFDFVEVARDRFIVTEGRSEQEANANARLVWVAPDMLAILKKIYSLKDSPYWESELYEAIEEAKHIIAKAEEE